MTRKERRKQERLAKKFNQTIGKNDFLNAKNTEGYMIYPTDDIKVVEKHFEYIAKQFFDKELCANIICVEYKGEKNIIHTLDYGRNPFENKLDVVGIYGDYCEELGTLYNKYITKEMENYKNNTKNQLKENGFITLSPYIPASDVREANDKLVYFIKNKTTTDFFQLLVA